MIALGRVSGNISRRFYCQGAVCLATVLISFFSICQITTAADVLEILGVRMGMTRAALQDSLEKSGIPISDLEESRIAVPRLPVSLDGVREVRLSFESNRLKKIVILFDIPPYEPTASTLIQKYKSEKERLKALFGTPADDRVESKPPKEQERYQWLARGGGYLRAMWNVPETRITLWLYGEDDGLVFQEIYEGQ